MTTTPVATIITDYARTINVRKSWNDVNLQVTNTDHLSEDVWTSLTPAEATELATALLGDNATVITDLPEVTVKDAPYYHGENKVIVKSGNAAYYDTKDPEDVLERAKELLAIHKVLVERQAEKAEAEEAAKIAEAEAAAKRAKRRDEVASELRGYDSSYFGSTGVFQKAIDRIIELEEAQA